MKFGSETKTTKMKWSDWTIDFISMIMTSRGTKQNSFVVYFENKVWLNRMQAVKTIAAATLRLNMFIWQLIMD